MKLKGRRQSSNIEDREGYAPQGSSSRRRLNRVGQAGDAFVSRIEATRVSRDQRDRAKALGLDSSLGGMQNSKNKKTARSRTRISKSTDSQIWASDKGMKVKFDRYARSKKDRTR